MLRKTVCILLSVLLILPLCACGNQKKLTVLVSISGREEELEMLEGLKKSVEKSKIEIKEEILSDMSRFSEYQEDILSKYNADNTDVVFSTVGINFSYAGTIPYIASESNLLDDVAKPLFSAPVNAFSPDELSRAAGQYVQEHYDQGSNVGLAITQYSEFAHGGYETLRNNLHHFNFVNFVEVYGDNDNIKKDAGAYIKDNDIDIMLYADTYFRGVPCECFSDAEHVIYYGMFSKDDLSGGCDALVGNSYYEYGASIGEQLINYSKGIEPTDVLLPITVVTKDGAK